MLRVALVSVDEFAFQPGVAGLRAHKPCGLLCDLLRVRLRALLRVLLRLVRARGAGNGGVEELTTSSTGGRGLSRAVNLRVQSSYKSRPQVFQFQV